jgi:hypothetical protein
MTLRKMQVEEATSSPYRVPEAFDRLPSVRSKSDVYLHSSKQTVIL